MYVHLKLHMYKAWHPRNRTFLCAFCVQKDKILLDFDGQVSVHAVGNNRQTCAVANLFIFKT